MALTLVATPGAANANSYCDEAFATAYHEAHPYGATWTDGDAETKKACLITATRLLDEQFDWFGRVVNDTQRLLWPRDGVYDLNGYEIDDEVIPEKLQQATAELARLLLASDRTADNDAEAQGIKRVKAGSVEVEFDNPQSKTIPDAVVAMVGHLGRHRHSKAVAHAYRV